MLSNKDILDLIKIVSHYEVLPSDSFTTVNVDVNGLLGRLEGLILERLSDDSQNEDDWDSEQFEEDLTEDVDDISLNDECVIEVSNINEDQSNHDDESSFVSPRDLHKLRPVSARSTDCDGSAPLEFECVHNDDDTYDCDVLFSGEVIEEIDNIHRTGDVLKITTRSGDEHEFTLEKTLKTWEKLFPDNVNVFVSQS